MNRLGYYLIDNVPAFKTSVQVEVLQSRGYHVEPITEDEFYKYFEDNKIIS